MDAVQRARNDDNPNGNNLSTPRSTTTYMPSKSTGANSSLLPPFDNQSQISHLPTPQSPNPLQLHDYALEHSQQSPNSRYFASSRPGSACPPHTPHRDIPLSRSNQTQSQSYHSSSFPRLVASEPRPKVPPSYSENAIVTPSPEMLRARLPSSDTPITPTPKPAIAGPVNVTDTALEQPHPHPHPHHSHSPSLSSFYQSSPEHHTRSQTRRHPRQRTMSIDEPETPVLNLNLPLGRSHVPPGVVGVDAMQQQSCQSGGHDDFDPDDPFVERDTSTVGGSHSRVHDELVYPRDGKDIQGHGRNSHSASEWDPKKPHRNNDSQCPYAHENQLRKYSETPLAGSSFSSSPSFLSPDYRYSSREQQTLRNSSRKNTKSPLTPCPVTPPSLHHHALLPDGDVIPKRLRSRTLSPLPSRRHVKADEYPTTPPQRHTRTSTPSYETFRRSIRTTAEPSRASSPRGNNYDERGWNHVETEDHNDNIIPGGELTRIRALRIRLEGERAAACEPYRPDYLVRTQRDKQAEGRPGPVMTNHKDKTQINVNGNGNGSGGVPEPERVTPVKRRDASGIMSDPDRKRPRLDSTSNGRIHGEEEDPQVDSALGIVETPTRGRRLTLYQPRPRTQNSEVDLSAIGARAAEGNNGKEEPRTPPPLSSMLPISSPRRGPKSTAKSLPSPPPPYALALRSIDWHTPRSSRARGNNGLGADPTLSSFPSIGDHNHNGNGTVEEQEQRKLEEERRLAIKERRLGAFRATQPSGKGERLRPFESVACGRIIVNSGYDDVGDLVEAGVIADTEPANGTSSDLPQPVETEHCATSSIVSDWPETVYPWSIAAEQRAEQARRERERRLACIERYLDRESESESEEDPTSSLLGHAAGMDLMLAYETLARTLGADGGWQRKGKARDRNDNLDAVRGDGGGRGKVVALSAVTPEHIERERVMTTPPSSAKGRKARGNRNSATKKTSLSTASRPITTTTTDASSSQLTRRVIFPTSTADARFALLSRKRVRQLAEKLREREEEGIVMCICQGGDDGRAMVRCDRCRVWYHLVCVDIHDANQLEDEWFCFKCVGDDEEEEEGEEGSTIGEEEEEEEEPGVAHALNKRMRVPTNNNALNARSSGTVNSQKRRQQMMLGESSTKPKQQERSPTKEESVNSGPSLKPRRKRKTAKEKQRLQKVPDFAPAMPESPVRPGVGDQMLYQHHQMFSLQPSPMPPSPVNRRRTPGVSPTRRGRGGSSGVHGSSSSSSFLATPSTTSFFNQSQYPYRYNDRSRSRSSSRDRNGNRGGLLFNPNDRDRDASHSFNLNNGPSTPRRLISTKSSDSYYSYNNSISSSPSKIGLGPPLYLTPKPSYDDAPFDPTSTPSRGLTFPAPVTPISSSRGATSASGSGRYGYSYGYGYGDTSNGGGNGSGSNLGPPPRILGTPRTPTHGMAGHDPASTWSGWGDESPVRRKRPEQLLPSSAAVTTPFGLLNPRRSALLDSPFAIGPSSSSSSSAAAVAGSGFGSRSLGPMLASNSTKAAVYPAGSLEESPTFSSSRDAISGTHSTGKVP